MPTLIVEQIKLELPPAIVATIKEELVSGSLTEGMFFIGSVTSVPDALYFLWHLPGEVPVSAMIRRDAMAEASSARQAAQDFLLKWNQRIG